MAAGDVVDIITTFLKEKRLKEEGQREDSLKMLNMQLNMQSHLLHNKINRLDRENTTLQNDWREKQEEYESLTGEVVNLKDFEQSNNAVEVLDLIKSPILQGHEDEINAVNQESELLKNAISGINKRLNTLTKVESFYKGDTVSPKKGTDPEYFDKEDFSIGNLSKALGLDITKDDEDTLRGLPDYLADAITKGELGLDRNIAGLNTVINEVAIQQYKKNLEEKRNKELTDPGFEIEDYIKTQTANFALTMDQNITTAITGKLGGTLSLASQIAEATDPATIAKLTSQLDAEKIKLGSKFTGIPAHGIVEDVEGNVLIDISKLSTGEQTENDENIRLGSMILSGVQTYYNSMTGAPGDRTKRNIGPFLNAIDEMRLNYGLQEVNLRKTLSKHGINSPEYQTASRNLLNLEEAIKEITGYEPEQFKAYAPMLEDIHEGLKQSGLDLLKTEYDMFKGVNSAEEESTTDVDIPIGLVDQDIDRSEFKDDYYNFDSSLKRFFNLDTDGDNVADAIDLNNDGYPDSKEELQSNFKRSKPTSQEGKQVGDFTVKTEVGKYDDDKKQWKKEVKLYDDDGTYVRALNDTKEVAYFSNYNEEHPPAKKFTLDKLKSTPSRKKDALMYYVDNKGRFDVNKMAQDLNVDITSFPPEILDEIERLTGVRSADSFLADPVPRYRNTKPTVTEPRVISPSINPIVNIAPAYNTEPTGGEPSKRPHWTLFTSLGGGDLHGDNSPFYHAYYAKLQELFNDQVDIDDSVWFKNVAKFKDWKEAVGTTMYPFNFGFDQDWEVVEQFKEKYPDIWEMADAEAYKAGMADQTNWVAKQLGLKDTNIDSGKDYTNNSFSTDTENLNEILKILSAIKQVKYQ